MPDQVGCNIVYALFNTQLPGAVNVEAVRHYGYAVTPTKKKDGVVYKTGLKKTPFGSNITTKGGQFSLKLIVGTLWISPGPVICLNFLIFVINVIIMVHSPWIVPQFQQRALHGRAKYRRTFTHNFIIIRNLNVQNNPQIV